MAYIGASDAQAAEALPESFDGSVLGFQKKTIAENQKTKNRKGSKPITEKLTAEE
jgi:hypothetical protein